MVNQMRGEHHLISHLQTRQIFKFLCSVQQRMAFLAIAAPSLPCLFGITALFLR
ncbi:hypothetical protein Fmac_032556 [Flemingia macrophylla]|uniref:Uncharacterized protein n=1 Tax=Flemingia macrophylla TaxID=520843 RepID=A0ABD1L6M3_9FABA